MSVRTRKPGKRAAGPVGVKSERVVVEPRRFFRFKARPPVVLAAGFLLAILTGSLLLSLPVANQTGAFTPFLTSLFAATSAFPAQPIGAAIAGAMADATGTIRGASVAGSLAMLASFVLWLFVHPDQAAMEAEPAEQLAIAVSSKGVGNNV